MSTAQSLEHVSTNPGVCGGKPCVSGTRIRVWDVKVWHDLQGQSPEQIVAAYPQLTIADVHAALAYYLDHRELIERQMNDADDLASTTEAARGETRFSRLRDQVSQGLRTNGSDPISP